MRGRCGEVEDPHRLGEERDLDDLPGFADTLVVGVEGDVAHETDGVARWAREVTRLKMCRKGEKRTSVSTAHSSQYSPC